MTFEVERNILFFLKLCQNLDFLFHSGSLIFCKRSLYSLRALYPYLELLVIDNGIKIPLLAQKHRFSFTGFLVSKLQENWVGIFSSTRALYGLFKSLNLFIYPLGSLFSEAYYKNIPRRLALPILENLPIFLKTGIYLSKVLF